jgi:hypothetical protein
MKNPLSGSNKKQKDFITIGQARVQIKCKSPKWLKVRRRLKKVCGDFNMGMNINVYEVRVQIKGQPFEYYSRFGKRISNDIEKIFHFERNKPEQAIEEGRRYGKVINCRKVKYSDVLGEIEGMKLNPQPSIYAQGNPYKSAIAMSDMIWEKRNIRRLNAQQKDRNYKKKLE